VGLFFGEVQAGVDDGMVCSPHREQGEAIQTLEIFGFAGYTWIKIGHIATKADFVVCGIQDGQRMDTTFALKDSIP
jgi:hypothetical protein